MGDIITRQNIYFLAAKNPSSGQPISTKDFEITVNLENTDYNENSGSRFVIPDGTTDQSLGMGTVAAGKMLVIEVESDIDAKIVNGAGTSQNITFKAGYPSILNIDFTDVLVSNSSGQSIKGRFFVVGD